MLEGETGHEAPLTYSDLETDSCSGSDYGDEDHIYDAPGPLESALAAQTTEVLDTDGQAAINSHVRSDS